MRCCCYISFFFLNQETDVKKAFKMRNMLIVQSLALFRTRYSHHAVCTVNRIVAFNVPASHIHTTVSSRSQFPGLVSTDWLAEALETQKSPDGRPVQVLDATRIGLETGKEHIPGSLHVDLSELRDKDSPYHYTVPTSDYFADHVGKTLGIDNDTHVVLYESKVNVMTAPRIWWMFRLFNHQAVSVLNGGLQTWVAEKRAVTEEPTPAPKPKEFKITKRREDIYKSYEDVLQNVKDSQFQVMDSRPVQWYDGSMPPVYPGRLGVMKNATNIPYSKVLVDDGSDKFKSPEDLRALYQAKGIDLSRPLTSTCHVGVTSCIIALGAHIAGKEDVAIFDGSWEEYSQKGPEDSMIFYEEKS